MKRKGKIFNTMTVLIVIVLSLSLVGFQKVDKAPRSKDISVIYTGDVHCAVDDYTGYAGLAAFKNELEAEGVEVILIDTGDVVQGAPIGSLSEGLLPIQIMNRLGYSAMTLGNHEFDYGQEALAKLSKEANFPFLSLNFIEKKTSKTVYEPYTMVERDGIKIAFIGITTPKTITSSRPSYFMDEKGNYTHSFLQDESGKALWEATQKAVDAAQKDGADYVIALAHLGINTSEAPYLSTELIANTKGIDVVLDGHSHSVIGCQRVQNKEGKRILLSSTGSNLENIGYLLISRDGNLSTGLVSNYEHKDLEVSAYIDDLKSEFEQTLKQTMATVEDDLVIHDPVTGVHIVRNAETNLGNLCADAIRAEAGADIAVINGGGIRESIKAGEVTYGDVLNVFPFGNHLRTIEITGQQILDVLEFSVSKAPTENGEFLHVSGLSFTFTTHIPSPVIRDNEEMFAGIEGERRVQNVLIAGKLLEADKTYSLASIDYILRDGGGGYSMFTDCLVLETDVGLDFDALLNFLGEGYLENPSLYEKPYGDGRIVAVP